MEFQKLDHQLDTLGLGVLQNIQSISVGKDAVIAGGYLRDSIRKGKFKDIDIFLPKISPIHRDMMISGLSNDYKRISAQREDFGSDDKYDMTFIVYDYLYLEAVPIQLIITNFPADHFTDKLLSSFDFGLCQVMAKDNSIYGTEAFNYDQTHDTATLLNISDMSQLPRAMKRFFKFQEKYPSLKFRCPKLTLTEKKDLLGTKLNKSTADMYDTNPALELPIAQPFGTEMVNLYLGYEIIDITDHAGNLMWDVVDPILNLNIPVLTQHINELIETWDGEQHGIPEE